MKWFGSAWFAPVCTACERIDIPVGELCVECKEPIASGDHGFVVPYMTYPVRRFEEVTYHYACFVRYFSPTWGRETETYIKGDT